MPRFTSRLTICLLAIVTGCDHFRGSSSQSGSESPSGPGQFTHSAIQRTTAPWDGLATVVYLGEKLLVEGNPKAPMLSVRINRGPEDLSGKRVRVENKEDKVGWAQWLPEEGKSGELKWVELEFEDVREGQPVKGTYDAAFPDGTHARGRFQAEWWKSAGRGG